MTCVNLLQPQGTYMFAEVAVAIFSWLLLWRGAAFMCLPGLSPSESIGLRRYECLTTCSTAMYRCLCLGSLRLGWS